MRQGERMNTQEKPNICIVLLNMNTWKDTIECLESIEGAQNKDFFIVVVDNASTDNSIEHMLNWALKKDMLSTILLEVDESGDNVRPVTPPMMNSECRDGKTSISIIRSQQNLGFAGGCNVGIRYALESYNPDFVLLLNNDTIVDPLFIDALIHPLAEDQRIGIAGSKIFDYANREVVQTAGMRIVWWLGEIRPAKRQMVHNRENHGYYEIDAASACSLLIRRDILEKLGLLDTSYFLYYEDVDLCVRTRRLGYSIVCAEGSKVWHKLSVTMKKNTGTREYYSARSLFLFMKRHASKKQWISFSIYFLSMRIWLSLAIIILHHREFKAVPEYLKGVRDGILIAAGSANREHDKKW
jgi:hypothetical protein